MIGALSAAAALLLLCSGLAKLRAPAPAARTIGALLPAARRARGPGLRVLLARAVGAGEVAAGAAALAVGGRATAAVLAAGYLVFAVVAARLRAGDTSVPCGCFGRSDAPVSAAHVVLNLVCAGVAATAAVRPVGAAGGLLGHGPLVATVGVCQVALLAWLGYLAITALPALAALTREA